MEFSLFFRLYGFFVDTVGKIYEKLFVILENCDIDIKK